VTRQLSRTYGEPRRDPRVNAPTNRTVGRSRRLSMKCTALVRDAAAVRLRSAVVFRTTAWRSRVTVVTGSISGDGGVAGLDRATAARHHAFPSMYHSRVDRSGSRADSRAGPAGRWHARVLGRAATDQRPRIDRRLFLRSGRLRKGDSNAHLVLDASAHRGGRRSRPGRHRSSVPILH